VPQAEGKKMTFGSMQAISLLKSSKNIGAAYTAAVMLTSPEIQAEWVTASNLPPVLRSALATLPGDAYKTIFYQSALIANAWLDPNREATNDVFGRMIENVTSGKLRVSESVRSASLEINNLLRSNI
jgi:ABC-type glycerol-3-phosphate transport system substrate-binding protein